MSKQIIKLTENQLKNIVVESVKSVLNEIGDTMDGKFNLANAYAIAQNKGRNKLARKISNYLGDIPNMPSDILYIRNNEIAYKVNDKRDNTVIIHNDGQISLNYIESVYINLLDPQDADKMQWIQTGRNTARLIVKWLERYCPNVDDTYLDWHIWASL